MGRDQHFLFLFFFTFTFYLSSLFEKIEEGGAFCLFNLNFPISLSSSSEKIKGEDDRILLILCGLMHCWIFSCWFVIDLMNTYNYPGRFPDQSCT